MANIDLYLPKLLKWEGEDKFTNDPTDRGGETFDGVTLITLKSMRIDKDGDGDTDVNDLKALDREDVKNILKAVAWNKWNADMINNQSIAEILVDWKWTSGKWGIIIPQRILGIVADGLVGVHTINAVNNAISRDLFDDIQSARVDFIDAIVDKHPEQERFHQGWINRINSFRYES